MGDPRDTTKTGKSVLTLYGSVSKTYVPANAPAGGGGNGHFTSRLAHGRSGGSGLHQQVSPTAKVYDPQPGYSLSELWDGGLCISEARFLADFAYGPQAVIEETGKRIDDIMEGLLPGLLMVGCVVGVCTLLGGVIGGAVGFLAFGAGAAPGAAIGAEVGFDAGMALVTWVGLGFLIVYVAESLGEVSSLMVEGVGLAWDARGKPPAARAAGVHAGAKKMGRAIGVFVRVLLEAIVLYLLEKGAPYVAARLSELVGKLKASKLGSGFAEWVLKNYRGLIEDPKVNPKLRTKKGGAPTETTTEAPVTPGKAKVKESPAKKSQPQEGATKKKATKKGKDRKPINSEYAGKTYPASKLPPELQSKYPDGVKFTKDGYPDFSPYAEKSVPVEGLKGNTSSDFTKANKAANIKRKPEGYTWHHHQDGKTMQLVPTDLHDAVRHSGGASLLRNK